MQDHIEREIDVKAPIGRVWTALTDTREFGQWFGMVLDGPFTVGKTVRGKRLNPELADAPWSAVPVEMSPQSYFSLTWHPYTHEVSVDYDAETPTLVEFRLTPTTDGTRVQVTESGFERLPVARKAKAFAAHEGGWPVVLGRLADHLAKDGLAVARVA